MNAESTRCIPIQCNACQRRYGVVPVTDKRDSVKEAFTFGINVVINTKQCAKEYIVDAIFMKVKSVGK